MVEDRPEQLGTGTAVGCRASREY